MPEPADAARRPRREWALSLAILVSIGIGLPALYAFGWVGIVAVLPLQAGLGWAAEGYRNG